MEFIIENLLTGKESCETEDSQYTPEDAIDYLQGFLQELNELNTQIIEQGNTPELLDCVFKKYTELWLFHFRLYSSCRLLSIEFCRIRLQSDYKNQQKKELRRDGGQIVHCPVFIIMGFFSSLPVIKWTNCPLIHHHYPFSTGLYVAPMPSIRSADSQM